MAYIMKMSLVFSLAWKAAAGVAAAEGMALGSWSYGAVRDKEAAAGALAAANAQHAREVASLQSLLRQEEYRQRHVIGGLVQSNQSLVAKLDALSKQLSQPIAAASQSASATHTAMSMLAAHQEQVAGQVEGLSSHQQHLTQLLLDIKEEIMALQGGEPHWSQGGQQAAAGQKVLGQEVGSLTRRRSVRHSVNEAVDATMQEMFACSPNES